MSPEAKFRWDQLAVFTFDAPDAVTMFEDKLIQETGWTRHFASRAIGEYRRFLLLAADAGHPVSPSPAVDHVWHLHLLYTRSYWDKLCPEILGFDLHHEPSAGTREDRAKLDDWYARTLASYRAMFDEPLPADVWPAQPPAIKSQRVDLAQVIVIPRALWKAMVASIAVGAAALLAVIAWLAIRSS